MPYVNIPKSKFVGGIARIVGKLQGDISSKVVTQGASLSASFRRQGCPTSSGISRIRAQKEGLDSGINKVKDRIEKFKKIPSTLEPPLTGLKAALKVIKTLPIPQSVPPGFGIPISITTTYADVMHLVKEFIAQIGEDIEGINAILETPSLFLDNVEKISSRLDGAIKSCETEAALREQVEQGKINISELQDIGLVDNDEIYIFSKLGPIFIGNSQIDENGSLVNNSSSTQSLLQQSQFLEVLTVDLNELSDTSASQEELLDLQNKLKLVKGKDVYSLNEKELRLAQKPLTPRQEEILNEVAENRLIGILDKIEKSNLDSEIKGNISNLLNLLRTLDKNTRTQDQNFQHTGSDGTLYTLEIIKDENSPSIAPRNYAIAKNAEGVVVFKGPKSFSSSTQILLQEIKFRIDNQLP
jgi:hypothetical protein